MKVKFKLLSSTAKIPTKATKGAAAYDLYATENAFIPPGETLGVGTGLAMEIPKFWKGDIYSRSGLASQGLVVANSPGKIDSDYRGEIKVLLHNNRSVNIVGIKAGDRIAQFEINPVHDLEFEEIEELDESERGSRGFGSTGK
jgi:dUTP pyrophosphatase